MAAYSFGVWYCFIWRRVRSDCVRLYGQPCDAEAARRDAEILVKLSQRSAFQEAISHLGKAIEMSDKTGAGTETFPWFEPIR
jgi:hypothetical protein